MKFLKIIGGILAGLLAIYLILCTMGSNVVDVTRYTIIDASPNTIFPNIVDMAKWEEWGTWYEQDPDMKINYSENTVGIGAKSTWLSKKLGNGNQEIIEVQPNQLIKTKMQFEGWDGYAYATIGLDKVDEEQTKVSWTLKGDSEIPFLMRGMGKLMDFEGAIKRDYDTGLASLKALSEKMAAEMPTTYSGYEIKTVNFPAKTFMAIRKTVPVTAITPFYAENLPKIFGKVSAAKGEPTGMPFGIFYDYNETTQQTDMAAAVPVKEKVDIGAEFSTLEFPTQKALLVNYYGGYEGTAKAHEAIGEYIKANGLNENMLAMEEYVTDPTTVDDPSKVLTRIYYLMETI